jgi:signal peptidase I
VTRRPPRWILDVVETLVLTLIIFVVIQAFVAQPFQVKQTSMERTLEPGQYVLVDKLTPRWDAYKRGDIVVLHPPSGWEDGAGTPFIKRVIGLAGDRIELTDDGVVVVNGTPLDEGAYTYRDDADATEPTIPQGNSSAWTVPAGELFVMGDHRAQSADSRSFGPIPVTDVVGRAFLRYWPAAAFGILVTPAYP